MATPDISGAYIANATGGQKIYFDADPTPFPVFAPKKFGSILRSVPTRNSSTATLLPGTTIAFDTGSDLSAVELDVHIPYLTPTNFITLFNLFTQVGQIQYSPDNGATVYLCVFRPGPLGLTKPEGWLNYSGTIKLQVLSQLTGTGGVGGPGGGG